MIFSVWNYFFAKTTEKEAVIFEVCPSTSELSMGTLLFLNEEGDLVDFDESHVVGNRFHDLCKGTRVVVTLLRGNVQSVRLIEESPNGNRVDGGGDRQPEIGNPVCGDALGGRSSESEPLQKLNFVPKPRPGMLLLVSDEFRRNLANRIEDKKGVVITKNLTFSPATSAATPVVHVRGMISNNGTQPVYLRRVRFEDTLAKNFFKILMRRSGWMNPGAETAFEIVRDMSCGMPLPKNDDCVLCFEFDGFEIARVVKANLGSRFYGCNEFRGIGEVVRAPPRPKTSGRTFVQLPRYVVPERLGHLVRTGGDILSAYPVLSMDLLPTNYRSKFNILMNLQSLAEEFELSKMSMMGVEMERRWPYLAFDVPELKEGRPSLVPYDIVRVTAARNSLDVVYEGTIMEIRNMTTVFVQFDRRFQEAYKGEPVDVHFRAGIEGYRRAQYAIQLVAEPSNGLLRRVAFPVLENHLKPMLHVFDDDCAVRPYEFDGNPEVLGPNGSIPMTTAEEEAAGKIMLRWFNARLNDRQRIAVEHIVSSGSRIPYVIFGPPGTGKTITVVEAVLQVYHLWPHSRILVAVPSNSAGDLICARLAEYHKRGWVSDDHIMRFLAWNRDIELVPEEVHEYVQKDDAEMRSSRGAAERLGQSRIVIATWHMCGTLYTRELTSSFFTHVFVDEAGHLTEPECMVPVSLCSDATRVTLAGDPHQLGPVILCNIARKMGLGRSLMQRLMEDFEPYKPNLERFPDSSGYNPAVATKLIKNYRSHPQILEIYSNLSYDGELIPCIPDNGCPDWVPGALQQAYPLLVVGVKNGNMMKDNGNPSPYNSVEITHVSYFVNLLVAKGVLAAEIGVITPYRKQAQKLRAALERYSPNLKIGSVEEFQGSERKVVIISTVQTATVRKGTEWWTSSFFSSKRHTNVAISRAQQFLIVVGDPELMSRDEHWRQVLDAAQAAGPGHYKCIG